MALTEEERQKIIEEERIRADERAKYAQQHPQQVVIREKRKGYGCGSLLVLIIVIGVLSSLILTALGNARDKAKQVQEKDEISKRSSQTPVPITQPIFDVPSLTGKDLTEIKTALGEPTRDSTPPPLAVQEGLDSWEIYWEKEGQDLSVSYHPTTKKITEFFIGTNDPSGATKDTDRLLKIGNLKSDDPRYKVKFVPVLNAYNDLGSYTGVKIIPQ